MEIALAEKSVYLPPFIVGALMFYRIMTGGLLTNHPVLKPIAYAVSTVSYIADRMMYSLTSFMGYTHNKALVIRQSSSALVSTLSMALVNVHQMLIGAIRNVVVFTSKMTNNAYAVVVRTTEAFASLRFQTYTVVYNLYSNMTSSLYSVVVKTQDSLQSIRFQFKTVAHQTYNITGTMFRNLGDKVYDVHKFFFPPKKSFFDYTTISLLVATVLIIIGLTFYVLSKQRSRTVLIPEKPPVEESVKLEEETTKPRRNPVRRKTKMN